MDGMTDHDVLRLWVDAMRELRRRGVIRTWNNPVADIAEALVASRLKLTLAGNSEASYDGCDAAGRRYQIKSRRVSPTDSQRQLSYIRKLDQDGFDDLVIVLFEEDLTLRGMWRVPIEVVRERAVYQVHVNGHRLSARDALLSDPRVERLDGEADHVVGGQR